MSMVGGLGGWSSFMAGAERDSHVRTYVLLPYLLTYLGT